MEDDTQHLSRESLLGKLGISVRGIALIMLVASLCACALMKYEIDIKFYSVAIGAVGYYFGQQHSGKQAPKL